MQQEPCRVAFFMVATAPGEPYSFSYWILFRESSAIRPLNFSDSRGSGEGATAIGLMLVFDSGHFGFGPRLLPAENSVIISFRILVSHQYEA